MKHIICLLGEPEHILIYYELALHEDEDDDWEQTTHQELIDDYDDDEIDD